MNWKETWIYKSGDIWLPRSYVDFLATYIIGDDTTVFYLSYWHFIHFLSGILFGLYVRVVPFNHPWVWFLILHTVWEAWQLVIGMTPKTERGLSDIGIDTLTAFLGIVCVTYIIPTKI